MRTGELRYETHEEKGRGEKISPMFLKDLVVENVRGVKSDGYKDGAVYGRQCSVFSGSHRG